MASTIDFAAMSDFDNENNQTIVLKPAENSKIPDTVTPKISELRSLQGLPDLPRIIQGEHPAIQKISDAFSVRRA